MQQQCCNFRHLTLAGAMRSLLCAVLAGCDDSQHNAPNDSQQNTLGCLHVEVVVVYTYQARIHVKGVTPAAL